jgi:hypothetical protein
MAKQLIVVVHGVGVKEAGISADLLATALDETPEDTSAMQRGVIEKPRPRPHSSDDFHQREFAIYNEGGKRQVFPARIRRYRQYHPATSNIDHERVIADFYWGDIAAIGASSWSLVRGFLTTVLGLSHVIRESASEVFDGKGRWDRTMRWLANVAVLTIHGPIAAGNIVLLAALSFSWLFLQVGLDKGSQWAAVVAGTVCLAVGAMYNYKAQSSLARHLWWWTAIAGLVLLAFGMLSVLAMDICFKSVDLALRNSACFWPGAVGNESVACSNSYGPLHVILLRMVRMMEFAWLVVLPAALALWIGEIRYNRHKNQLPQTSLVVPGLTLMILLWTLLIGCAWAVVKNVPKLVPHRYQVDTELGSLVPVLMMLGFLAAVAVYMIFSVRKFVGRLGDPTNYLKAATENAEKTRLIVSPLVLNVMDLFLLILLVTAAYFAIGNWLPEPLKGPLDVFQKFKTKNVGTVMLIAAAVGAALVTTFAAQFRAGLGIATDVITYLNNYSWNEPALKEAEKVRAGSARQKYTGYWPRERIRERLLVLVDQLVADEDPDELAIVSHSQGTVVALDVLDEHGRGWLKRMKPEARISLVTMGSPYTHIHNHYFPTSFPAISQRPALRPAGKGGVIARWINIFRVDDFVGTHVDPTGNWPVEKPVKANGHTYYWVDENVFPILKEFLEFTKTRKIEDNRNAKVAATVSKPAGSRKPRAK